MFRLSPWKQFCLRSEISRRRRIEWSIKKYCFTQLCADVKTFERKQCPNESEYSRADGYIILMSV